MVTGLCHVDQRMGRRLIAGFSLLRDQLRQQHEETIGTLLDGFDFLGETVQRESGLRATRSPSQRIAGGSDGRGGGAHCPGRYRILAAGGRVQRARDLAADRSVAAGDGRAVSPDARANGGNQPPPAESSGERGERAFSRGDEFPEPAGFCAALEQFDKRGNLTPVTSRRCLWSVFAATCWAGAAARTPSSGPVANGR